MNLIVIRHALAEDREEFALKNKEDSLRPLTDKGRKKMLKMFEWVEDTIKDVDLIVSSPYLRAMQTAEILQGFLPKLKIEQAPELVPHCPPQAFMKWLKAHARDKKNVAVIGHEPQLSLFISFLLSSKAESFIDMKKSGIAMMEVSSVSEIETAHSQLLWLLCPKVIQKNSR